MVCNLIFMLATVSASAFLRSAWRRSLRRTVSTAMAGFSLIELLLVLAIIGIVTALALPNYRQHIQRGQRAEAAAALFEAQHFMARYYSAHGRYDGSTDTPGKSPDLPLRLQRIPADTDQRYQLLLGTATVNSYELKAIPVGTMMSDKCGTLTLNQTGLKGLLGSDLSVADCWR